MRINKLLIFNLIEKIINTLFFIWIFIILIGALYSDHLFPLDNPYRLSIITGLVALILIILGFFKFSKFKSLTLPIFNSSKKHKIYLLLCISVIVFSLQIFFINKANTGIGFDAGIVASEVVNHSNINDWFRYNYFSFYPNNLLLLYTEYFWSSLFGSSWLSFSYLSLLCVDLFMITSLISIYLIDKTKIFKTWSIFLIWLSVFPYIIVPYTDTTVLPLISTYILGYTMLKKATSRSQQIIGAFLLGIFAMLGYLMKPTAVIPLIAIIVVELLYLLFNRTKKEDNLKLIIKCILVIIAALCVQFGYQIKTNNQEFVHIDQKLKVPAIHFISMGMHDEGGFSQTDAGPMYSAHSSDEMKKISKEDIKTRISEYTPYTYGLFLIYKNYNNTADGSFGWLQEGNFIDQQPSNFVQNWIYPNGKYLNSFYVIVQILWILALLMLLLTRASSENSRLYLLLFKVALLGGFTYLLIFEGGRSRYLIQFIPVIVLLLGLSNFSHSTNNLN